jgi:hypothetical protein
MVKNRCQQFSVEEYEEITVAVNTVVSILKYSLAKLHNINEK